MKKINNLLLSVFFLGVLFLVPLLTFLNRGDYSFFENRALQKRPTLSSESLFSGAYFKDWESYLSDRIFGRTTLGKLYVDLNMKLLSKPVVNEIAVQKDLLLPYHEDTRFSKEAEQKKIDHMVDELAALDEHVTDAGGRFLYVGAPEQYSAMRDFYPGFLKSGSEKLDFIEAGFFEGLQSAGVSYLNMREVFCAEGIEGFYSRIDHHFTYKGAHRTYEEILAALGGELTPEEFDFISLPNYFTGSRNRKLYNRYETDEKLVISYPLHPVEFTRTDNGVSVNPTMYALPPDDKEPVTFTVYMGGDVAETVIETGRDELPRLLFVGDSFTNPVESMLYLHFGETRILDLRHYHEKTLYEYITEFRPDYVVLLRDDTNYVNTDGNGSYR